MTEDQTTTDFRATELADKQFVPMQMSEPAAKPEPSFSSETEGLRAAATELQERRATEEREPIRREYRATETNERMPLEQTRKLSEAADDLKNLREVEDAAASELAAMSLREKVDHFLAQGEQQPAASPAEQQPQQQQAEPAPQPESVEAVNGVDPEVARALENPKIRQAINEQISHSEQARQQYMAALHQVSQIQAAAITRQFPELAGATQETLPAILNAINVRDPARAQAIVSHLQSTSKQIEATNQQIRAEQQRAAQQAAHQFQAYSKAEDSKFEEFEKTRPASEVKAVRGAVIDTLVNHYGVDKEELARMWATNPMLRAAPIQRLLYDITRFHIAQDGIKKAPPVNRPVMRPGEVDTSGADHSGVREAMREFSKAPTAKSAAAALMARRRAAANQR
jgi:hypothetical protein